MAKVLLKVTAMLTVVVILPSVAGGFGVARLNTEWNPLYIYPGETKTIQSWLQVAPPEADTVFRQTITLDPGGIASLPGGADYIDYVVLAGQLQLHMELAPLMITIPHGGASGNYCVNMLVQARSTDTGGGTVGILIGIEVTFYISVLPPPNTAPVAVCQDVVVAVGADGYVDASIDGGSYDPDGDYIDLSQNPAGPYTVGVYTVTLTVTDTHGASESCQAMLVVYDPSGGFVTGGGWIWSPKGAYIAYPWLEGNANFGFVSKYKKGATVPTGQTEFVFQAGNLNFHSSSYEWLVVTGSNYARFKGTGTINGAGDYKFMLWAGDGEPDTFRIKIWEEDELANEEVVYDNGLDQRIGGGSIVVHTD